MQMIQSACAGALMVCGAWLAMREFQERASGRGGRGSLIALGFFVCGLGVLVSQA